MYYTFIDDGILEMSRFWERDWSSFETSLNEDQPTVGFSLGSTLFHHENVDANLNAFHCATLGMLLPCDTSLDDQGIYFSQYNQNILVSALHAHRKEILARESGEVYTSRK